MKKGSKTNAHQALYRKYRSRSLDDVVGQKHVTGTLKTALKSGNISHAYLFSGPRGVGKTSIARILAYQINEIPYDESSNHLDIIEIDAASNRRIDDIRDLRSKVNIAPSSAKYKVYIIDEVHMLTKESFNALLKTLEEPPEHAVFILATTEAHKLPPTIISRTQHYQFRALSENEISQHLAEVARQEDIKIDKTALDLIAKVSLGGMRDALSLLDQISNSTSKVDLGIAEQFMGLASKTVIKNLIKNVQDHNLTAVVQDFNQLVESGADIQLTASQLYQQLKTQVIANPSHNLVDFMNDLLLINNAYDPKIALEITLFKHTVTPQQSYEPEATNQEERTAPKQAKVEINQLVKTIAAEETVPEPKATSQAKTNLQAKSSKSDNSLGGKQIDNLKWQQVIDDIKQTNNTLAGLLRQVIAEINSQTILVFCPYSFHVKRIQTAKYQKALLDAVARVFGGDLAVEVIQNSDKFSDIRVEADEPAQDNSSILAIKDLMGGEIINV